MGIFSLELGDWVGRFCFGFYYYLFVVAILLFFFFMIFVYEISVLVYLGFYFLYRVVSWFFRYFFVRLEVFGE